MLAVVASIEELLGDRDAALDHLGGALRAGYQLWEIQRDPAFEALREDPRFAEVVRETTREERDPS